jgi:hypothetical protein
MSVELLEVVHKVRDVRPLFTVSDLTLTVGATTVVLEDGSVSLPETEHTVVVPTEGTKSIRGHLLRDRDTGEVFLMVDEVEVGVEEHCEAQLLSLYDEVCVPYFFGDVQSGTVTLDEVAWRVCHLIPRGGE